MADVNLNGTTYTGVEEVALPDGSGGTVVFSLGGGGSGVGIESIMQTYKAEGDDEDNIITIKLTDGTEIPFTVQNGSKGSKGDTGPAGVQGIQGIQGIQGEPGEKGDKGDAGEKGETGEKGADGVSPEIVVWDMVVGQHTVSITDVNGEQNFVVYDGKDGEKGEKGDKGDTGDTGAAGKDGTNGEDGRTPVRGEDYWTAADIAEIKGYVDDAILGGAW